MFRLDGKIAVVTGSGSGIGKAISILFARQGAIVHLLDLNQAAVEETAAMISKENGKAVPQPCDVTGQAAVKALFTKIGRIDILVNSAGVSHVGNVEQT